MFFFVYDNTGIDYIIIDSESISPNYILLQNQTKIYN